jgi:hypothetical protein
VKLQVTTPLKPLGAATAPKVHRGHVLPVHVHGPGGAARKDHVAVGARVAAYHLARRLHRHGGRQRGAGRGGDGHWGVEEPMMAVVVNGRRRGRR